MAAQKEGYFHPEKGDTRGLGSPVQVIKKTPYINLSSVYAEVTAYNLLGTIHLCQGRTSAH